MALFKGWASTLSGLSVDANNPDRVMVTTINGSLLTVDGGHSWNVIHSAPMRATGNEGGGIAIMSAWHYAFDPHRADRQIISMNDFRRRAERRRRTHVEPLHRRQPLAAEHLQRALRPARRRPRVGGVFADARHPVLREPYPDAYQHRRRRPLSPSPPGAAPAYSLTRRVQMFSTSPPSVAAYGALMSGASSASNRLKPLQCLSPEATRKRISLMTMT